MAVLLGWLVGSLVVVAIASLIIEAARKRAGKSHRVGSVVYAVWVSLALYGAGAREDYSFTQAGFYVVAGAILVAILWLKRPDDAPKANLVIRD